MRTDLGSEMDLTELRRSWCEPERSDYCILTTVVL
jgi:hypothetical protein